MQVLFVSIAIEDPVSKTPFIHPHFLKRSFFSKDFTSLKDGCVIYTVQWQDSIASNSTMKALDAKYLKS